MSHLSSRVAGKTKSLIQALLRRIGYDIHKYDPTEPHRSYFADQKMLLAHRDVRFILDVGAHVGDITATFREFFPKAHIISIEPDAETYGLLKQRFGHDPNVTPVPAAIAERQGTLPFNANKSRATSSLLEVAPAVECYLDPGLFELVGRVEVQATTLDDLCRERGIESVGVLKMDIQGAELRALRGARGLLEAKGIDLIFCEVSFVPTYKDQPLFHDLALFLREFGYNLFNLYAPVCRDGRLLWGDAIFMSPAISSFWDSQHRGPERAV